MAIDSAGWIYVGIGNCRGNIVAYPPGRDELRQIPDEEDRGTGRAELHRAADGKVYGVVAGPDGKIYGGTGRVLRMFSFDPGNGDYVYWGVGWVPSPGAISMPFPSTMT